MKVVINKCYGGFSISKEALEELYKRKAKCLKVTNVKDYFGKNWQKEIKIYTDPNSFMYGRILIDGDKVVRLDDNRNKCRTDPDLIAVVESMREKANGQLAELKIVNIPKDMKWEIDEYDGIEHVAEKHRTWG